VTCSDDSRHRIWKVGLEHKIENEEVKILGRAEIVVDSYSLGKLKLETTPTTSRTPIVYEETTPSSDSKNKNSISELHKHIRNTK